MPLRRTERSNGRQRPKGKDGSHDSVENTLANKSRCICLAVEPTPQTEQLVTVPPMLGRKHEPKVSTRDRRAKTGADARIEEFTAIGELRLALRPYGKRHFTGFRAPRRVSTRPERRSNQPKRQYARSAAAPAGSSPPKKRSGSSSKDFVVSRAFRSCPAARASLPISTIAGAKASSKRARSSSRRRRRVDGFAGALHRVWRRGRRSLPSGRCGDLPLRGVRAGVAHGLSPGRGDRGPLRRRLLRALGHRRSAAPGSGARDEAGQLPRLLPRYLRPAERRPPARPRLRHGLPARVASDLGFEVRGLDLNEAAIAEAGRDFGARVHAGPLDDRAFPGECFDVVTLIAVFEHVPDPAALLAAIAARLASGGIVAATLPDTGSWVQRLLGHRWPHYNGEHLYYWSLPSLARFLEREGWPAPIRAPRPAQDLHRPLPGPLRPAPRPTPAAGPQPPGRPAPAHPHR